MISSLFDELRDAIFFSEIQLANEIDLEVVLSGQLFGRRANLVAQRFDELRTYGFLGGLPSSAS